MTKKRTRSLKKCAHFQNKNCPHIQSSETGKFKCDICTERERISPENNEAASGVDSEDAGKG